MTEREKLMCQNIAAIMRVKRLGVKWVAPQARMSSGALQAVIDGRRKVSDEEAALLARAMGVEYKALYATSVAEALERNKFVRGRQDGKSRRVLNCRE